jgi:thiol:disulfide interchange protein
MPTTLMLTLLAIPSATDVMRQEPAPSVRWWPYKTGLDEAKRRNVPLFVVARAPYSFWCVRHGEELTRNRTNVRRINERFVPVCLSWTESDQKDMPVMEALGIQSFPTIIIMRPDGTVLHFLEGFLTAEKLETILSE